MYSSTIGFCVRASLQSIVRLASIGVLLSSLAQLCAPMTGK